VKSTLLTALLGVFMGMVLSRIGYSSWDDVHAMFVFSDLRMFLAFGLAVALLFVAHRVLIKRAPGQTQFRQRPIHKGTLVGGLVFGAGWAISGACPSIALVQLGEGQLAAGWTLLGIVAGNWLCGAVHMRFLRWDTASCIDE
jgi:uncharacterized membrane protein YedE/YeeE